MTARQVALPTGIVASIAGAWDMFPVFASLLLDAPRGPAYVIFVLGGIVALALNPAAIFGIGYWASGGTDISEAWMAYAKWAFGAAVVGYLAGGLIGLAVVSGATEISLSDPGLRPYYSIVQTSLFESTRAAVAGVAGASIGHFQLH